MKMNKRGFSLVELLVAVALVAVAALLMYSFFGQGFSLYSEETGSADEQMGLRQAMSEITNVVRVTSADDISVSNGVLNVGSRSYSLEDGCILRNGTDIADGISTFNASIDGGIIHLRIVSKQGTVLETSLSLLQR